MIKKYNNISLAVGIPGLLLPIIGPLICANLPGMGGLILLIVNVLFVLIGTVLLLIGLAYYAKAKGRSSWWCLMASLWLIGLIVLACLKDKAIAEEAKISLTRFQTALIRPSRWYYALAVLIFVTGVCLFVLILFQFLPEFVVVRVVVPGQSDIELSKAGTYTIFHEYRSLVDGKFYNTTRGLSGLRCRVTSSAMGTAIPLSEPSMTSSYAFGSRAGVSVLKFSIEQPGIYKLSAEYPPGQAGPEGVLTVGQGLAKGIGTALVVFFGSMTGGIIVAVVTSVKRRKAKRQMITTGQISTP